MLQLRDYQDRGLESLRSLIRQGRRRIVLVSPTGSGKGVLLSVIIRNAVERGNSVLFIVHRDHIINQISRHLLTLEVEHGVIMSDDERTDPSKPVQLASIQTLIRRPLMPEAGVVIVDEAHHSTADSYKTVLASYGESVILGFTATPYRTDGRGLGEVFESIVVISQVEDLIQRGYLVQPRLFAPTTPNMDPVRSRAGDFETAGSSAVMSALAGDALEWYQRVASDRQTIVFTVDVAHSVRMFEVFSAAGVACERLDGETPREDREGIFARFSSRQTNVLINCQVLTEGVDLPICSCVSINRPTMSRSLWRQMVGRALRPYDGKTDALILDHAGNSLRHGFPTQRETYTLHGREVRSREHVAPVSICTNCLAVFSSSMEACPSCGAERKKQERRVRVDRTRGLEETSLTTYAEHASDLERVRLLAKWRAKGAARGYKNGYHRAAFRGMFGVYPTPQQEADSMAIGFPRFLVRDGRCRACLGVEFGVRSYEVYCRHCERRVASVPNDFI